MSWAYAWAVAPGAGKEEAQDFPTLQVHGDLLAMAVCDGAGSAANGGVGSRIAAMAFCAGVAKLGELPYLETSGPDWAGWVLERIREEIATVAAQEDQPFPSYACTLVGVVASPDGAFFVQVGDGAAAFVQGGERQTALIPEEAEFLNTTFFVTDESAATHLQTRWVEGDVDEIALFTDGISGLVLHPGTHQPHDRFFETVFRNVRASEGQDEAASAWLATMLRSDLVTSRTDDDTSIVVARRT